MSTVLQRLLWRLSPRSRDTRVRQSWWFVDWDFFWVISFDLHTKTWCIERLRIYGVYGVVSLRKGTIHKFLKMTDCVISILLSPILLLILRYSYSFMVHVNSTIFADDVFFKKSKVTIVSEIVCCIRWNAMQCNAMLCNAMWCNLVHCNAMLSKAIKLNKTVNSKNSKTVKQ